MQTTIANFFSFPRKSSSEGKSHQFIANVDDKNPMPTNIKVCKVPDDLPDYESVLNAGNERRKGDAKAIVSISDSLVDKVAVLQISKSTAAVVISTVMFRSALTKTVLSTIREQLSTRNIDLINTYWALPEFVAELSRLKEKSGLNSNIETKPDSENEKHFRRIISKALAVEATDFHIESKKNSALVRLRIDSELYPLDDSSGGQMMHDTAQKIISYVFTWLLNTGSNSDGHYNPSLYRNCTVSIEIDGKTYKLRVQSNPTISGPDLIARILKEEQSRSFEESGYSVDQIEKLNQKISVRNGNIYFAGIPNSGKTTSTRACLESMPNRERLKIVMIADPIEYELPFVSNATIQRSLNQDDSEGAKDNSYMEAVNSWLRGNPDVIDMGEIRDRESGIASITVGETGCLALGTVHAHSALGIFQRLTSPAIGIDINTLTAPKMVSLLVYQSLVPKLCTACRIPFNEVDASIRERMTAVGTRFRVDMTKTFYRARKLDCPVCGGRGIKGVTLVAEMIVPTPAFLEHIRKGNYYLALDEWAKISDGRWDTENMNGKEVFAHAFYKAQQGIIDPHVVEDRFGKYELVSPTFKHLTN